MIHGILHGHELDQKNNMSLHNLSTNEPSISSYFFVFGLFFFDATHVISPIKSTTNDDLFNII